MYKAVFQNSKVALLFALATIVSAVSMVGTPEESGLLPKVVGLVDSQRGAAGWARGGDPQASGAGEASGVAGQGSEGSVFGDYSPGETPPGGVATSQGAGAGTGASVNPMTAPLSPTAIVTRSSAPALPFVSEPEPEPDAAPE